MRTVRVLPDVAAIDKTFDYTVPERWAAEVRVGTMVRVVLQGRRVGGWVVADDVEPESDRTLLPLAKVSGWGPPASVLELASWAAWRWAGRRASLLGTASPAHVVSGLPAPPAASSPPWPADPFEDAAFEHDRAVVRVAPATTRFGFVRAAVRAAGRTSVAGAGGSTLVLCPSQAAAAQVAAGLSRDGVPVALLPRDWARARAGGCVVVGARAAAWAPIERVGAVVVFDAHDEAYQEERAPTWQAWQVAAERAARDEAPCVLVSPCPTLEQLAWGRLITPPRAIEGEGWGRIEVLDRRSDDPRTGLYSEALVRAIRDGGRVVCVLNRKGRARLLACAACGDLLTCERCQALVEQRAAVHPDRAASGQTADGATVLACRACATERPAVCTSCGATKVRMLRVGVTRIREDLERLVGGPVHEVTAEAGDLPSDWRTVVGTEAALHRVTRADVVAFLEFDQELLAPRYRAGEQALALLARASRIVGGRRGRVVVQSRLPRHEVLEAALHGDPSRLIEAEQGRRSLLRLPPVTAIAAVSGEAADAYIEAARADGALEVLGPDDGRWLLRAPAADSLCDALAGLARPPGRLRVEVDPLRV